MSGNSVYFLRRHKETNYLIEINESNYLEKNSKNLAPILLLIKQNKIEMYSEKY